MNSKLKELKAELILNTIAFLIVLALLIVATMFVSRIVGEWWFSIVNNKEEFEKLYMWWCWLKKIVSVVSITAISIWAIKRVNRMF